MKTFLSRSAATLLFSSLALTSVTHAAGTYSCTAGRVQLIHFTMQVMPNQLNLVFEKSNVEGASKDLSGKSVTLKKDDMIGPGWNHYAGKTLVDKIMQQSIFLEVGIERSTLASQKAVHTSFAISPPSSGTSPSYLNSYGIECVR